MIRSVSFAVSSMPRVFQVVSPSIPWDSGADEPWEAVPTREASSRLGPLEVVRYSDVDEEPRANQAIHSAIKKAGKNLSLQ